MDTNELMKNIETVIVNGVKKYKYQDSPVFDTRGKLLAWMRKNLGEL